MNSFNTKNIFFACWSPLNLFFMMASHTTVITIGFSDAIEFMDAYVLYMKKILCVYTLVKQPALPRDVFVNHE